MKSIHIIAIALSLSLLTSCSTTEKFTLYGTPGTEIYDPLSPDAPCGTIQSDGTLEMKVSSDRYCGYLLSRTPGDDRKVPFGLDIHNTSHGRIWGGLVAPLGGMAVGAALMGGAIASGSVIGASVGVILFGSSTGVGCMMSSRGAQLAYAYQFGYNGRQHTIQDIKFSELRYNDAPKIVEGRDFGASQTPRRKASSGTKKKPAGNAVKSSRSRKTFADFGKSAEGTYHCKGTLAKKGEVVERYADMTVVIERIDKTSVRVTVLEGDEEFFEEPYVYDVKKLSGNGLRLTLPGVKGAVIDIASEGKLRYTHPSVNIDGDIYILSADSR